MWMEKLLEGTGAFWRRRVTAETEIPQCRTGVVREQQAPRTNQQSVQKCDGLWHRAKTGLSRLFFRRPSAKHHPGLPGEAVKVVQDWNELKRHALISVFFLFLKNSTWDLGIFALISLNPSQHLTNYNLHLLLWSICTYFIEQYSSISSNF